VKALSETNVDDTIFTEDNLVKIKEGDSVIYRPKQVWSLKKDYFTLSPLYDYFRWQELMGVFVTGQNYLRYDLTKKFLIDLKYRVEHEMNVIISIWGLTGTGKSAGSLIIALLLSKMHNKLWTFDFIKDNPNDILLSVQQNDFPIGTVFVVDEQDTTRAGVNALTMIQMLQDLEKRIRKKQWHFIYNSPVPLQHSHHYILKTDGIDRVNGKIRFKLYDAIGLLHGYVVIPFPDEALWKEYNDKFKENILDEATSFVSTEEKQLDKLLDELYENPFFWGLDNNSQRDAYLLMKYPTMCRAKTFRVQLLSIMGIGGKKEYCEQMKNVSVSYWMDGKIEEEDTNIMRKLRPSWFLYVENFQPGEGKGKTPKEFLRSKGIIPTKKRKKA
jgi:hypothetical protein